MTDPTEGGTISAEMIALGKLMELELTTELNCHNVPGIVVLCVGTVQFAMSVPLAEVLSHMLLLHADEARQKIGQERDEAIRTDLQVRAKDR